MYFRFHSFSVTRNLATFVGTLMVAFVPANAAAQAKPEQLWAGIEIGGTGVKAVVLEESGGPGKFKDISDPDMVIPGNLAANLEKTKDGKRDLFAEDAINRTVRAVHNLRDKIKAKHEVPDNHIFVVASGGVWKLNAVNYHTGLAAGIKKEVKLELGYVDPKNEVMFTFLGIIGMEDPANALLIDIGGSNTKFGYVAKGSTTFDAVPYGTNVFLSRVDDKKKPGVEFNDETFSKAVEEVNGEFQEDLRKAVEKLKQNDNAFGKRKVFLTGGASWAMAVLLGKWPPANKKEDENLLPVELAWFDKFAEKAKSTKHYTPDENEKMNNEHKGRLAQEVNRKNGVRKVFSNQNRLRVAATMLQTVRDTFTFAGTGEPAKPREIMYVPNSHLIWIRGYIKNEANRQKTKQPVDQGRFDETMEGFDRELQSVSRTQSEELKQLKAISTELAKVSRQLGQIRQSPANLAPFEKRLRDVEAELTKSSAKQEAILKELSEIRRALRNRREVLHNPFAATIVVTLPKDAMLSIDDQPSHMTGSERTFVSPALEAHAKYYYLLTATVVRDGQKKTDQRQVSVRAGQHIAVDFNNLGPVPSGAKQDVARATMR